MFLCMNVNIKCCDSYNGSFSVINYCFFVSKKCIRIFCFIPNQLLENPIFNAKQAKSLLCSINCICFFACSIIEMMEQSNNKFF